MSKARFQCQNFCGDHPIKIGEIDFKGVLGCPMLYRARRPNHPTKTRKKIKKYSGWFPACTQRVKSAPNHFAVENCPKTMARISTRNCGRWLSCLDANGLEQPGPAFRNHLYEQFFASRWYEGAPRCCSAWAYNPNNYMGYDRTNWQLFDTYLENYIPGCGGAYRKRQYKHCQ